MITGHLTIRIDSDLKKQVKTYALKHDTTITKIINEHLKSLC